MWSMDSSVSIETDYGLDGPGLIKLQFVCATVEITMPTDPEVAVNLSLPPGGPIRK
jgi:hypothetical protein